MKVKDLKKILNTLPDDKELIVFAEGKLYPLLEVQDLKEQGFSSDKVELACGWCPLEDEDEDDWLNENSCND